MITLHITELLLYFLKQKSIYTDNCPKNFLSDFGNKKLMSNLPVFHKAENFFDIFTCHVVTYQYTMSRTSTITIYKKHAGNWSGKCERATKLGHLNVTLMFMM